MSMTDRAIIKALEYCSTKGNCYKCYYQAWYTTKKCREHLAKEALDLIQRQQERIERLKDNLDAVLAERADYTEAVREFADRIVCQLESLQAHEAESHAYGTVYGIKQAIEIVQGVSNDDR